MRAVTLTDAFDELGRIRHHEVPFADALRCVADVIRRTVAPASEVSVMLLGAGGAAYAVHTGHSAAWLDRWQGEHGHGPCIAAAAANITVTVSDVAGDCRWPHWTEQALHAGVHSCLSVGLPLQNAVASALTVYAAEPDAFDDEAIVLIQTFAGYAAMAMANAHLHPDGVTPASVLRAELAARTTTEQAVGIVMAHRRCTAEQAAATLVTMSGNDGRDLRAVAAGILADAQAPGR